MKNLFVLLNKELPLDKLHTIDVSQWSTNSYIVKLQNVNEMRFFKIDVINH